MSIIFPLITFTYAARVLGVNEMGAINYSKSIITYFTLISSFGISNYAIREGARIREKKKIIDKFATEMFIINICSTAVASISALIVINIPKFAAYKNFLCVFFLMVPFTLIGVEWVYSIFEDYFYITVRAILVQIISLCLLFLLVKSKKDSVKYVLITVVATVGSNLFNFFHSRKYIHFFENKNGTYEIKKHLTAISTVFMTTLASQIYLNMDVTMVGYMAGDYASGIYSASNKLVVTVTTLISSLRVILLPRLSFYLSNKKTEAEFEKLNLKSSRILLCVCVPLMIGIFFLSGDAISIFCGDEYMPARLTLKILVFGMVFSALNGFIVYQIFMPLKKERIALMGTIIGAIVNLTANSILIKILKQDGAAVGTVLAEISVFIFCALMSREYINYVSLFKVIMRYFVAGIPIALICVSVNCFISNIILRVIVSIVFSACAYFIVLKIMKDEVYKTVIEPVFHSMGFIVCSWLNSK